MTFKKGDKIKGISNNGYGITDENMYLGEVKETVGNFMVIVVLKHECPCFIGKTYRVHNSGDKFEIVKNKNRKFFKSLPNDFTGTLEVENGFIVEKEILDDVEKEYLSAVIKPFKDRVKYINKWDCPIGEFIEIGISNDAAIPFPNFKKGTMYKGMEVNKNYTLKELGLDE